MTSLKPQYRAINKKELGIARKIIQELAEGPIGETDCRKVIPNEVSTDKIRVWMNGRMVVGSSIRILPNTIKEQQRPYIAICNCKFL